MPFTMSTVATRASSPRSESDALGRTVPAGARGASTKLWALSVTQIRVAPALIAQGRQAEREKALHRLLAQRRERVGLAREPLRLEGAQGRGRCGARMRQRIHATRLSRTQS